MKKYLLLVGVILCLVVVPTAVAQGPWPTEPGNSGVQAVNMDRDSAATVIPIFIAGDGTQYVLPMETLDPGESFNWYAEPGQPDTFHGAVQLFTDTSLAAIGKTEWGLFGPVGAASYSAKPRGARTVVLPLLVIEHYGTSSAFVIQNTDLENEITVDLNFVAQEATPMNVTKQITIAAGANYVWSFEGFDTDFPDPRPDSDWGWIGAVRLTSGTPVVAAAYTTDQELGFVYAYDGFTDTSQTKAYAPLVRHNYADLTTGIQVVDTSGNGGVVQIKYVGFADSNGNWAMDPGEAYTYTDQADLDPFSSLTFYQGSPYLDESGEIMPERFLGSAEITVSGVGATLAVVVNDQTHYAATDIKHTSAAYSGFFDNEASDAVTTPLARNEYYNFTTGVQVQNIGRDPVTVEIQYTRSPQSINPSTPPEKLGDLEPGQSTTFYLPIDWGNTEDEHDWLGSAIITATGSGEKRIVAITNDQDVSIPFVGDTAIFNCPAFPPSGTVVVP